ncbi:potassium-transporting ATPase subunit KdpA [Methylomonas paludis]|uniref:Potassium-transporting ATPase potassium-binding subunit n=1 Tax=Methylomonas paludis TaxID=1173101 RepID=A0A975R9S9_9GAMM|nr:potassium-transporting ATPase subunit KdpA [Methylomonas paludis]QWF70506.1 potassium-transporting ATPase subunit KdpA [Methylomonas paludis]
MSSHAISLLVVFLLILLLAVKPLGAFITAAMEPSGFLTVLAPFEQYLFRLLRIDARKEMHWQEYAYVLVLFNALAALWVYALQRWQADLPLNPQDLSAVSPDSSLNTAISFLTAACWQGYAGEITMSYLTQMLGLGFLNFVAPATGLCVAFVLFRGFARHETAFIGNFWVDMVRACTYVLLPLSVILAIFLVQQGAIQNFKPFVAIQTMDVTQYQTPKLDATGQPIKDANGQAVTESVSIRKQILPMGPAASLDATKVMGNNGGGFFNVNAAHPFENPTPLTNFAGMLAMFLIPAVLCFSFGRIVGDTRQGWAILFTMVFMFAGSALVAMYAEQAGNPLLSHLGLDQSGGNLEGKEMRFGSDGSALWAVITTASGTGGSNAMHDSFTPIGGFVCMWLMQVGEVVFGGVGVGLVGMLIFAIIAVFISGLMIGRTPEYLGKKIESYEMKMISISILITPLLVLVGTAISILLPDGKLGILNPGSHGFSEVLYAFSSAANNNGSAFAGLSANTPYYNTMLAVALWFGRFFSIVPYLAIAGALAKKHRLLPGEGTLPTHGALFIVLLIATVLIVGALTYFPALVLGPFAEHFALWPHGQWSQP